MIFKLKMTRLCIPFQFMMWGLVLLLLSTSIGCYQIGYWNGRQAAGLSLDNAEIAVERGINEKAATQQIGFIAQRAIRDLQSIGGEDTEHGRMARRIILDLHKELSR